MGKQNIHIANGQNGGVYINNTATKVIDTVKHPGGVTTLYPLADAVLASGSVCNIEGLVESGDTLPVGIPIFGRWSAIQLSSGRLIGYYQN